jgi:tRNA nucleotidyltransferase (CCA-adding enzyme)
VRDALLDRLGSKPDLDLVVPTDALDLCRQLSRRHGGSTVVLDAERSIARLAIRGWSVDLARQEGPSLEADLRRRDYTVNAIALPLEPHAALLDPTGGLGHLQERALVAVSEANLLDDPLRLLRGLRLASELGFELEARTWAWIQQHHGRIATVAGERVLAELEKLAGAPQGQRGLQQTLHCGLLQPWAPPGTSQAGPNALEALTPARAVAAGLSTEETLEALPLARLAARRPGAAGPAQQPQVAAAGGAPAPLATSAWRHGSCSRRHRPAGDRSAATAPAVRGRSARAATGLATGAGPGLARPLA